jgi:hypothetical protein
LLPLKSTFAKLGHDVGDVKAKKQSYDKLRGCCQYDRVKTKK